MDATIQKANDKLEFISSDKDALRLYEMREMALSDYTSGINFAQLQKSKEIAKNALKEGATIEFVHRITGLDIITLEEFQAELNNE